MKIGILTYHRSHNYGALLQAVALRYRLVKFGHEVYFIDYWPEYHRQMYSLVPNVGFSFLLKRIQRICSFMLLYKSRKKRLLAFNKFIDTYINPYTHIYAENAKFDVIIYGSDQIWRKQEGLSGHFDAVYFADNILMTRKNISYAASMGNIDLLDSDYVFLKDYLNRFSYISVREDYLRDVVDKLGYNSQMVLDPTLLLLKSEWNELFKIKRIYKYKYVLYYRLLNDSFDEKQIRNFANTLDCELIILDGAVREIGRNVVSTAGPMEFLSLIKYADFVFSSSYHGLMFSLIFEKQFYVSFKENAARAQSILSNLNLSNRLLAPMGIIPLYKDEINYCVVEKKIEKLRNNSLEYILKSIG